MTDLLVLLAVFVLAGVIYIATRIIIRVAFRLTPITRTVTTPTPPEGDTVSDTSKGPFDDLPTPRTEPNADLRGLASAMYEQLTAYEQAGFTRQESLRIVTAVLAAMATSNGSGGNGG